jgi:putative transposase
MPERATASSRSEKSAAVEVVNLPRFADMPPARMVPMLADEGVYIATESTFPRVLREHWQMTRRGRARAFTHPATDYAHYDAAPRQAWCWDMMFLPATVTARWCVDQ